MALREITDRHGVRWQVWAVRPSGGGRGVAYDRRAREHGRGEQDGDEADVPAPGDEDAPRVREQYRGGWLAFQSRVERRRLAPIPDDWEGAPDARLAEWCEQAVAVGRPRRLSE